METDEVEEEASHEQAAAEIAAAPEAEIAAAPETLPAAAEDTAAPEVLPETTRECEAAPEALPETTPAAAESETAPEVAPEAAPESAAESEAAATLPVTMLEVTEHAAVPDTVLEVTLEAPPEGVESEVPVSPPPPAAPAQGGASLWRNRNFNVFWTGQTLSALGDSFAVIALPLLVLQATGSVAQMGLVTATFGAGQFLAGLFAGPLVDRVDRRKLMIFCDVGRMLLYATIPLGWWLLGPQLWLIYGVVGLAAVLSMCFSVAYVTAIPNLVDREQIMDANGRLQATLALGWVIGPMLAGLISAQTGPALAVGVDALSFAFSTLSLMGIRLRQAAATPPTDGVEAQGRLHEMLAGIRFLLHEPVLRWVMVLFACGSVLMAGTNDLFIYHIKNDLHQGDTAVGVLFGAASIGGILGAVMAARLRRWLGFGPSWLGGWAIGGLLIAAIGVVPQVSTAAVLAMAFVYFSNIAGINGMTVRQEITPDHLLGRVTSAYFTAGLALGPVGAAGVTALAERFGAPPALVGTGLAVTAVALLGVLTPSRERRPERRAALYAPVASAAPVGVEARISAEVSIPAEA